MDIPTALTRGLLYGALFVLQVACLPATAGQEGPPAGHAVASAHPLATRAGMEILAAGGNAFDAAVTVSAVLAVVEPYSSGLGGGGFWLLHRASDGFETMVDGRERAPLAARRDMYLDQAGEVVPGLSMNGPLAAGIPGEPAALVHISERYGALPLSRSLAPAIRLAEEGFAVDALYRRLVRFRLDALRDSSAAAVFLADGRVPEEGAVIRQPDLAWVLRKLAAEGRQGFYSGDVAHRLVNGVREAGGIWSLDDLRSYRVVEREPVRGSYRGMTVVAAAPPSSGGVVLVEMLNILSGLPLEGVGEAGRIHLLAEAMRRAYRDRAEYLGDPDLVDMPLGMLLSPEYAAGLRAGIRLDRATPSSALPGITGMRPRGADTTHFSVLDDRGNRVAATLSINYPFGACFVPPGTGVLLNDEMDDFAARPGTPNAYGLVGTQANSIAPGKRMLSSMTPAFLEKDGRLAIVGTPGGSRIITMVLQAALEFAGGADATRMVNARRIHHQYLPDAIQSEPGAVSPQAQLDLEEMGHTIEIKDSPWGNMQVVILDRKQRRIEAASDPRGIGRAVVSAPDPLVDPALPQ